MDTLFVFSHLRWDFVYQRPQQLMSRLAQHYRIFFIEEPLFAKGASAVWQASEVLPQLTVWLQPATAALAAAPMKPSRSARAARSAKSGDAAMAAQSVSTPAIRRSCWHNCGPMRELLVGLVRRHPRHLAWLYTPMALPALASLDPHAVVYDCMDELSAFLNPPPGLIAQEQALFERADLVFAGGPSLYAAKRRFHRNVHCFPSSVDVTHFRQALDRNIAHPDHRRLSGPKLGFFGVLDERFDATLVTALADAEPDWQIVLVGPVAKIDPDRLPQQPNIHYTGQQPYAALPAFLASWDVCLLPFALNAATRFISPTKSLEYMAAELPIVSTAVPDVVDQHADVIAIAQSHEEFIAHCRRALALSDDARQRMIRRMRAKLAATSWDATAEAMWRLLRPFHRARTPVELGGAG